MKFGAPGFPDAPNLTLILGPYQTPNAALPDAPH